MKKKIYRITLVLNICLLICGNGNKLHAQKGIVGISDLVLTKYPGDTTEVIRLLHKGDTIDIIWSLSNSIKVAFKNEVGFVSKDILNGANFYKLSDSINNSLMSINGSESAPNINKDSSINASLSRLDSVLKSESKRNIALNIFSDSSMKANKLAIENNNLKTEKNEASNLSKTIDEPLGFKSGFMKLLVKSFLPVLIIALFFCTTKGKEDGRFLSGFRPSKTNGLLAVFLTGIICTLIGLCGGIYYWASQILK